MRQRNARCEVENTRCNIKKCDARKFTRDHDIALEMVDRPNMTPILVKIDLTFKALL